MCAVLAPDFKMAAFLSVDEVREMVVDGEVVKTNAEDDQVRLKDKITECLKMVRGSNIDLDFFVDARLSMLVPLYYLSQQGVAGLPEASIILSTQIQSSSIMRLESRLQLEAIYRRLAGRVKNPFKCKMTRGIPQEFFLRGFRVP